jgi:hypothetical protein
MILQGKSRKQIFSLCPSLQIMSFGTVELPPSSGKTPKEKNVLRWAPEKKLVSIPEQAAKNIPIAPSLLVTP